MSLRIKKGKVVLAVALLALILTGCASNEETGPLLEDMTTLETVDFAGNEVDSSMFKENKLTVLNLWNLGCTPCIDEIPVFEQLNNELAEKGVSIKGVYYNFGDELTEETYKEIYDVLTNANATYQQLEASESMMESKYFQNIQAFPTTLFIDSEGNVVSVKAGSNDYEGWKKIIEDVLAKVEKNA